MSKETTKKGCHTRKCADKMTDCSTKTATDKMSKRSTSKACSSNTRDCSTRNSASKTARNCKQLLKQNKSPSSRDAKMKKIKLKLLTGVKGVKLDFFVVYKDLKIKK